MPSNWHSREASLACTTLPPGCFASSFLTLSHFGEEEGVFWFYRSVPGHDNRFYRYSFPSSHQYPNSTNWDIPYSLPPLPWFFSLTSNNAHLHIVTLKLLKQPHSIHHRQIICNLYMYNWTDNLIGWLYFCLSSIFNRRIIFVKNPSWWKDFRWIIFIYIN